MTKRFTTCETPEFDGFAIYDAQTGHRLYPNSYPGFWRDERDAAAEADRRNAE